MKNIIITVALIFLSALTALSKNYERAWNTYPYDSIIYFQTTNLYDGVNGIPMDTCYKLSYTFDPAKNLYTQKKELYSTENDYWVLNSLDSIIYDPATKLWETHSYSTNNYENFTLYRTYKYDSLNRLTEEITYEYIETDSLIPRVKNYTEYSSDGISSIKYRYYWQPDKKAYTLYTRIKEKENENGDMISSSEYYQNDTVPMIELLNYNSYNETQLLLRQMQTNQQVKTTENTFDNTYQTQYIRNYQYDPEGRLIEQIDSISRNNTLGKGFIPQYRMTYQYNGKNEYFKHLYHYDVKKGEFYISSTIRSELLYDSVSLEDNIGFNRSGDSVTRQLTLNRYTAEMKLRQSVAMTAPDPDKLDSLIGAYKVLFYYPVRILDYKLIDETSIKIQYNDSLDLNSDLSGLTLYGTEDSDFVVNDAYINSADPTELIIQFSRKVEDGEHFKIEIANGMKMIDNRPATLKLELGNVSITKLHESAEHIRIWPNITNGPLQISSGSPLHSASIYSMGGNIVLASQLDNQFDYTLDIATLPAGMYQVHIETSTGLVNTKIMKQ